MEQRSNGSARTHNLPSQPTPFIGRTHEVAELNEVLNNPACRLLTLFGPGGIGKTRLAIQAASNWLGIRGPTGKPGGGTQSLAHDAYFVPLQAVGSFEYLVSAVADAVSFSLHGSQEPQVQVLNYLRDRHSLLLLDNFEHLLAPSPSVPQAHMPAALDLVIAILNHAPGVKLLVTSREVLNLREEWLYPVQGLPFPKDDHDDDWEECAAVRLFLERARRVRHDFAPGDEREGVIRICRLVEGMPLAIELAGSLTRNLNSAAIADEIQRDLDFLATSLRNVPQRHRSMRAAIDYSWTHLTPDEQGVFKRLSVFRGGFQRLAAEQVAGATLPVLTTLVDKSLLQSEPSGRYQMHELLHQYAREQLEETPEEAEHVQDLHCVFYTDFLHRCTPDIEGGKQREIAEEMSADLENIRLAWRRAVETARVEAIRKAAFTLQFLLDIRGYNLENAASMEIAVQCLDQLGADVQTKLATAHLLVQLGWTCTRLGQIEEAQAAFGRSREIYEELGQLPPSGFATDPLLGLGIVAVIRGDYLEATQLAEAARQRSQEQGDTHNLTLAYHVLADAAFARGEYETAHVHAQRAYTLSLETGNRWFMAYVVSVLGNLARAMGNYDEAQEHYQTSYDIKQEFNDPEGMAVALNHLARVACLEERHQEAQGLLQQSLAIYREINDRGGLATSLSGLGDVAQARGDMRAACGYYRQALQVAADMQFTPLALAILTGTSELLLGIGHPERGAELLALVLEHPASDQETRDRVQTGLARAEAGLAPALLAAAVARGKSSQLETTLSELLVELAHSEAQVEETTAGTEQPASAPEQPLVEPLTPRELEVLGFIAQGLTNQQIADELIISVGTVKFYTAQIYGKLGVHSRTQAVAYAREIGLLS